MGKRRKKKSRDVADRSEKASQHYEFSEAMTVKIESWAQEAAEAAEVQLLDVDCVSRGRPSISITIQRPGPRRPGEGVRVNDCADVSRYVEAYLDAEDGFPERYALEVTSPGVERDLKKPKHYEQELGSTVRIITRRPIQGDHVAEGVLESYQHENHSVLVQLNEPRGGVEVVEIALDDIKKAHLTFDFNAQE